MTNVVAVCREDATRAREKRFSVQTIPWLRVATAVYVYRYIRSVFPLTVLKSQQCLHTSGRDKIYILYRQAVTLCAWTYWRICWVKIRNNSRENTNAINKMACFSILEKTRFEIHLATYVLRSRAPSPPPPNFLPTSKSFISEVSLLERKLKLKFFRKVTTMFVTSHVII